MEYLTSPVARQQNNREVQALAGQKKADLDRSTLMFLIADI